MSFNSDTLLRILEGIEMRYQDPKLERHGANWRIRPYVVIIDAKRGKVTRQRRSVILGPTATMSRADALREKQKQMATINAGQIVVQAQLPFSELIRKFETAYMPLLGTTTKAKYASHIKNHIEPELGALRLYELNKATIQAWLIQKRETGKLSWATRADLRGVLASIFRQAIEWKMWEGENPAHKVAIGRKQDAREKKILTPADFSAFLGCIPKTGILPVPETKLMILTAVVGGLRVSEVLGLQGRDVHPEGALTIRRRWHRGDVDQPKSDGSATVVIITMQLARKLAELGGGETWLFRRPDTNQPPDDRDLQHYVIRPAAMAAGCHFAGFGMHTLRRMMVTWSQIAGATPLEAMHLARHADVRTTLRYTVLQNDRQTAIAMELMKMAGQSGPDWDQVKKGGLLSD